MSLDVTLVVDAAHRILETYGLADLTMRRVADELGVKAGALYYHVPNKQTLLAKVADLILADRVLPQASVPLDVVSLWAHELRQSLISTRDGAELVASALASGLVIEDPAREAAGLLEAAGLAAAQAHDTALALTHFVLGHVVQEQSLEQFARLGIATKPALEPQVFAHGVAVFVRGIAAELTQM